MQESLKSKPRRSKGEIIEIHGGRIIRSTGVKDRHTKVHTARGPRDRRLRLSPNTAIQFYDVQDRLGYDRPSRAIDWLMKEAKSAIDALDQPPVVMRSTAQDPSFSYTNGEFNSVSYDQQGLLSASALNPSRIFNWNHGLGGGGGVSINYSQQDLAQNQIFFQMEPLQSSVNNYPPLSTPLITTVEFAEVVSAVPAEDKIPVFSKLQSASTFLHYQS